MYWFLEPSGDYLDALTGRVAGGMWRRWWALSRHEENIEKVREACVGGL